MRIIALTLLIAVMMLVLCEIFELSDTHNTSGFFYTYRNVPEGTIDAVYIGTSGASHYWVGAKAYQDYGMTVYPLSGPNMPCWLYTNVLEEALIHQKPQLVVIDIRGFTQDNDTATVMDTGARIVLDSMEYLSPNWFRTAFRTMEVMHDLDPSMPRFDISYLLPFVKYHTIWTEEDFSFQDTMTKKLDPYGGFYVSDKATATLTKARTLSHDPEYKRSLEPLAKRAFYDLLDFIEANDLQVLFVNSPQFVSKRDMGRMHTIQGILERKGYDYISFYSMEEPGTFTIDLNSETDFFNRGHVNFYGAVKFTDAVAAYIDSNYDLPDRRSDEVAKAYWDPTYENLLSFIADSEAKLAAEENVGENAEIMEEDPDAER